MKIRESGMPDEEMWDRFFCASDILSSLGLSADCGDLVEFGCGYGTFTVPAARVISGTVIAIDIEPQMIARTRSKAEAAGIGNIRTYLRDLAQDGTGLPNASVDCALLFNILHAERPVNLLREAHRVVSPGGKAGIIHWNHDAGTPRGPSMEIRPRPEQCQAWAEEAGFEVFSNGVIDLPPYHYGIRLRGPRGD